MHFDALMQLAAQPTHAVHFVSRSVAFSKLKLDHEYAFRVALDGKNLLESALAEEGGGIAKALGLGRRGKKGASSRRSGVRM